MKPSIPEVIHLFKAYKEKPGNSVWGSLHIVLEDGNIKNDHIVFCKEWARDLGDKDGENLCDILLLMSKSQRTRIGKMVK